MSAYRGTAEQGQGESQSPEDGGRETVNDYEWRRVA